MLTDMSEKARKRALYYNPERMGEEYMAAVAELVPEGRVNSCG
jgi:hypothetical protein